jgi:O-antigen ligase
MTAKKELNFQIPVLVTLLALYPLIFTPYILPRWASLMAISLFALTVIIKDKLFIYNYSFIPLCLFILSVFLSSLFSSYFQEAWLGAPGYLSGFLSYLFFVVLFLLAFGVVSRYPGKIERIINIWLLSASLIAILGLLEYLGLNILSSGRVVFSKGLSSSTIQNSNDLGTYMAMAFPFAAMCFLQKFSYRTALVLGLVYGCLLTTFCRSAWLGAASGLVFILLFYPFKKNVMPLLVIMLIITAVLLPVNNSMLLKRMGTFSGEAEMTMAGDPEGGSGRLLLWQEGFRALPQSPLLGSGPDTFYQVSPEKFAARYGENGRPAHKAHNIYLEIAVTMGIPALFMYLWFLGSIVSKTDWRNPLQFSFFVMVVIYLVRGFFLVDVITVYPLFWVLLGFYQGLKIPGG